MSSLPKQQSPLKKHYGYRNCIPTDGTGFPYGGFWNVGAYYSSRSVRVASSTVGSSSSPIPIGAYFVCTSVEEKAFTTGDRPDATGSFVVLKTLHPDNPTQFLWLRFWPTSATREGFIHIENEIKVLAIAATGL